MNIQQAKQLSLIEVMAALGHTPHHEVRGDVWYLSPIRQETKPSFKINRAKNVWYDFGEGQGGNIIDLVMQMQSGISVSDALRRLEEITGGQTPLFTRPRPVRRKAAQQQDDSLQIKKVIPLQNPSLVSYLAGRGINAETARPYVKEIHYTRGKQAYFALSFLNDSNGRELRNAYFKGSHGTKDVTTIAGTDRRASTVMVFEGFMDFLSAKNFYQSGMEQPVIVLNSASMKDNGIDAIKRLGVATVWLYLDHDEGGRAVKQYFEEQLQGIVSLIDKSELYAGYKDFNDFLVGTRYEPASFSFQ